MAATSLRCTAPNFSTAIEHASVSNRKPSFDNFGSSFETNAGRLAQHRCSAPLFGILPVQTSSGRGRSVSGPLSNELRPISHDSRLSGHSILSHSNVGKNTQRRGVRTQAQGQREREEEGQKADEKSKTVRNLLKELRETRGVEEAAKVGAEAVKAEAEKDLSWYRSLKKPWFSPPEPVYGTVWTVLYAMMGAATWLVITEGGGIQKQAPALTVFAAQLWLNFQWPLLFFKEKKIKEAQIDNLFLLGSLILTYQLYHNASPTAGTLILPSIIWVAFANVLNYLILIQNEDD